MIKAQAQSCLVRFDLLELLGKERLLPFGLAQEADQLSDSWLRALSCCFAPDARSPRADAVSAHRCAEL